MRLESDVSESERVVRVNPIHLIRPPQLHILLPTAYVVPTINVERSIARAAMIHQLLGVHFLLAELAEEVGGVIKRGIGHQQQRMFVPLALFYTQREKSAFEIQCEIAALMATKVSDVIAIDHRITELQPWHDFLMSRTGVTRVRVRDS